MQAGGGFVVVALFGEFSTTTRGLCLLRAVFLKKKNRRVVSVVGQAHNSERRQKTGPTLSRLWYDAAWSVIVNENKDLG